MRFIGLDTETCLIEPGNVAPRLVCMSTAELCCDAELYSAADAKLVFYNLITDKNVQLIFCNAPFDLLVLAQPWGFMEEVFQAYEDGRIRDISIRQKLTDIANGRTKEGLVMRNECWVKASYSLAALEKHFLGMDRTAEKTAPDAWRLRYGELVDRPISQWPIEAVEYAKDDATNTLHVFASQHSEAGGRVGHYIPDEKEQTYAAWALHLISARGIKVDKAKSEVLAQDMFLAREKNRKRLVQVGFLKAKRMTAAQVKAGKAYDLVVDGKPMVYSKDMTLIKERTVLRYKRIGQPLTLTPKGGVPTDKDTLLESGSPLLELLSEEGGVEKIITTYLPILRSGYESAICCGYEPLVNTGRCSSFRPNLQNIPSGRKVGGVRECFIPRDGYWFCSVDYDTLELRALAQCFLWLFKESKMAEALNAGLDLHCVVAAQLMGVSYEEAVAQKGGGAGKKARDVAKVANFGFPGGLGPRNFVKYARSGYGVKITEQQAREVQDAWRKAWPEMRHYHNWVKEQTGNDKGVIMQLGTQRVRGGCNFTEGANTLFQGLAGSGAKAACVAVVKEVYVPGGRLPGLFPIAMIHDEILAEVDIDIANEMAYALRDVMVEAMQKLIPDVKITASPALMSYWTKNEKLHIPCKEPK
jgi:DNA polymerase-1